MASGLSSAQRVQAHRRRLRAQGLRPVQIWVPDTRAPEFTRQAHSSLRLSLPAITLTQDQAFIDAVSWNPDA